jgi:hypothetical protein
VAPDRTLRWLRADPKDADKKLFVRVEHLLKALVTVEFEQEHTRAPQVTSLAKVLFLCRQGDAYRGELKDAEGRLPRSEVLSNHIIDTVISVPCLLCAETSPENSPQCHACLRTHCYKCDGGQDLEERYPRLSSYSCKECAVDVNRSGRDHSDAVTVEWEPRQRWSIDMHMHNLIMQAKNIPRPAGVDGDDPSEAPDSDSDDSTSSESDEEM